MKKTLLELHARLEALQGAWNGEDLTFEFEGKTYTEDHVESASEAQKYIDRIIDILEYLGVALKS